MVQAHDENGDWVLDIDEFISMQRSYWYDNCLQILGIERESFASEVKLISFLMVESMEDTAVLDTVDFN